MRPSLTRADSLGGRLPQRPGPLVDPREYSLFDDPREVHRVAPVHGSGRAGVRERVVVVSGVVRLIVAVPSAPPPVAGASLAVRDVLTEDVRLLEELREEFLEDDWACE